MKKSRRQLFSRIAVICLFLIGVLIMTYPFYVNALNNYLDQQRMAHYLAKEKNVEAERQRLQEENERLKKEGLTPGADPFSETSSQKANEQYYQKHFIGKINIPKLAVELSLFDTTTPLLLEKGATVLDGTSYPLGGNGTHAVISAHRGLPERELFTNLPKLQKGDIFLIEVLDQTLAYKVNDIQVVEPDETSLLKIVDDKDLVTLVTCTPYMINSHRLLVTGERTAYTPDIQEKQEVGNRKRYWEQLIVVVGIGSFIIFSIWLLAYQIYKFKLRKRNIDLVLVMQGNGAGLSLKLFDAKEKKAMFRNHKPYEQLTDEQGKVVFKNLPGAKYSIKYQDKIIVKMGIANRKGKVKVFRVNHKLARIIEEKEGEIYVRIL